jgi:hypothetical protein
VARCRGLLRCLLLVILPVAMTAADLCMAEAIAPRKTTPFLPEIWSRLEVGALICKSRDDLVRYQTQIANGSSAITPGQRPDCHTIRKQTGIQILAHDGPSRIQIVTTDESKETWWTNSYLPSTPPTSVAKGPGAGK